MKDVPRSVARVVARLPSRVREPVELLIRTIIDAVDDRILGLSAEIAFFVLLALPPLLLTIVGVAGLVGSALGADFQAEVTQVVRDASLAMFDSETVDTRVIPLVENILGQRRADVISFGFVLTLFSASRALRVLVNSITIAYNLERTRASWKSILYGLLLTVVGVVGGVLLIPVIVAGPGFGDRIAVWAGLPDAWGIVWRSVYWPTAFAVVTAFVAVLYHVAAPWSTPWRRDLPGAALATTIGLLGTLGLRVYSTSAFGDESVYGPLAVPLLLLLWLYIQGFAMLLGAEFNAEIERMWPTEREGQAPPWKRAQRRLSEIAAQTGATVRLSRTRTTDVDELVVPRGDLDDTAPTREAS